jgi:hypothetical protein
MIDEPADADQVRASARRRKPEVDVTADVLRRVLLMMGEDGESAEVDRLRGYLEGPAWFLYLRVTPEDVVIATPVIIFLKAYIEALAKRAGDLTADLMGHMRFRLKRASGEVRIVVDTGATVVITKDLPDEARLALLDLDVTSPDLAGKELHWDSATGTWLAIEGLPAELDKSND